MDEREIDERIQYFQAVAAKYGHHPVPTSIVYRTFEETIQPGELGFTAIKAGLYGRVVDSSLVHLMRLQALKGASYSLWWGVSLSYVPHEWTTHLRWHRTFKASRFDLFETPHDYFPRLTTDWREGEAYITHSLHGELYLRKTLHSMWDKLGREVAGWFSSTRTLDEVCCRAMEQSKRERQGPQHDPSPIMVIAFTLSRMGRKEEGLAALDGYFELNREPPEAQENLKEALKSVATG